MMPGIIACTSLSAARSNPRAWHSFILYQGAMPLIGQSQDLCPLIGRLQHSDKHKPTSSYLRLEKVASIVLLLPHKAVCK